MVSVREAKCFHIWADWHTAEISISYFSEIIDLRSVLRMVLPSIGSLLDYAVCRHESNPIFVQLPVGLFVVLSFRVSSWVYPQESS